MFAIAIDGPAGAGKSSAAKAAAKKLGLYLCGYGRTVSHSESLHVQKRN